jgi:predicted dienelactone hydrolase
MFYKVFSWGSVIALSCILLSACSDGSDGNLSAAQAPLTEPAEAAAEFGPFAVGHQHLEAIDVYRDNRTLPYDVWYPVDEADAAAEPRTVYPLQGPAGLTAELAVDDLPVSNTGPYPFLVFSHGSGGTNTQSVLLMETLASHGFIVVAPEHTGNTNDDFSDTLEEAGAKRVPDVSFMIDTFLARNEIQGDDFHQRIEASAIGVLGHSFGGSTALGMLAGFFGAAPDERVTAVMPISAVVEGFFTDQALAAVTDRVLFMGGTLDTSVPIENNDLGFDKLINAVAVYQADIVGATHTHFANICDIANWLIDNGIPPELWPEIGAEALLQPYAVTCSEDAFPIEEAQRIQNLYAVALFRRYLKYEQAYDFYLQPQYAAQNEPDVDYRARILAPE